MNIIELVTTYRFMQNALMCVLLITPLFSLLGNVIVVRKQAFFSDALGHSALTGIALGVIFGAADLNAVMVLFCIGFALVLNLIMERNRSSSDTIISVFSSAAVALGLSILSRGGNFSRYSGLLVGDILSIRRIEVLYLFILLIIVIAVFVVIGNKIYAISLERTLSRARQFPVRVVENIFAALVAAVVALSIRWTGILLINALLILPAASSGNISVSLREYQFFSVCFSMFSGVVGLFVSYYINVATGPVIVLVAAVIYFVTYAYRRRCSGS